MELIRIVNGSMTLHFVDIQYVIQEKSPIANLRVRSRKATLSDCTCFLRPGVDICVLSASQHATSSEEDNQELVSHLFIKLHYLDFSVTASTEQFWHLKCFSTCVWLCMLRIHNIFIFYLFIYFSCLRTTDNIKRS